MVEELPQLAAVLLSVTWGARCRRRKPDTWMRKGDREGASHTAIWRGRRRREMEGLVQP